MFKYKFLQGFAILIYCFYMLSFSGCGLFQDDVSFSRDVFERLAKGMYSARYMIEWRSFKMLEQDLGKLYSILQTEEERTAFERGFIDNFKKGFNEQKGSLKGFYNWRVYGNKGPKNVIVAVSTSDSKEALLFFIKNEKGAKKVVEIKALLIVDEAKFNEAENEQK